MAGRLADKVGLVTGAAQGMGASHARLMAREGASVVLADVNTDDGEHQAQGLRDEGLPAMFVRLDVARDADWRHAIAAAEDRFGSVDVLVNNAGVARHASLTEETEEGWATTIAVNQTGVFLGMRAVVPAMRRAGGGSIINVSSVAGVVGTPSQIAYHAAKGAVRLMTRSAALTLVGDRIRVNCIVPGAIRTPLFDGAPPDFVEMVMEVTPMRRFAEPEEVSSGVVYLASDESLYVTGTDLVIDGGMLAR